MSIESNFTDDDIEKLADFGPAITDEEAYELEAVSIDKIRGVQRRLVLVACSRSADNLSKLSIENPDAFLEMQDSIEAFKEHAKGLLEIAESACIRMLIADCKEVVK
jgi:hypothetical protein